MSHLAEMAEGHTSTPSLRPRWWVLALLGLTLGLVGGGLLFRFIPDWLGGPRFNGLLIQSPDPVPNFTLTGPDDQPVSLHDFRGQVTLLYFGYTYCPDVCPATMQTLARAREMLPARDREKMQVVMVSVDPERDTPETLANYLAYFDPTFIGLTGDQEALLSATTPLGIYFEKQEVGSALSYLVDHTATVAVVDQEGYLRLIYPFNTPAEAIAADVRSLIRD